jgi:adenylosuccinate lyase
MDASLWAVSPLDGRYHKQLAGLGDLTSEAALIGFRVYVEARWLLALAAEPKVGLTLTPPVKAALERVAARPSAAVTSGMATRVKAIEATTNHDVKAVEYYLREELSAAGADAKTQAFIHFACTSEDINNLAYALMLKAVIEARLLPRMRGIEEQLAAIGVDHADLPMLSRTHGQTATPTTLGKELAVFVHRLRRQRQRLSKLTIDGKMNGAVGNFNAHVVAYPDVDWPSLSRRFIEGLGLVQNPLTTQIENHDALVEAVEILRHYNTIAIGLCRDVWGYISLGYFKQRTKAGEIGSSTMPHKVNPIDFENAEGNLGLANALAAHFGDKLPISRWQRDLSDSTVLRAFGSVVGHAELSYLSLGKGLGKLAVEKSRIAADLDAAPEVLAEAVQTVMRRYGVVDAYERLKDATRGKPVTVETLHELIARTSELPSAVKNALTKLTPATYTGLAAALARAGLTDKG